MKYVAAIGKKCIWSEIMTGGTTEKIHMCVGDWLRNVLNKLGGRWQGVGGFISLEIRTVRKLLRVPSGSLTGRDCDWLTSISFRKRTLLHVITLNEFS